MNNTPPRARESTTTRGRGPHCGAPTSVGHDAEGSGTRSSVGKTILFGINPVLQIDHQPPASAPGRRHAARDPDTLVDEERSGHRDRGAQLQDRVANRDPFAAVPAPASKEDPAQDRDVVAHPNRRAASRAPGPGATTDSAAGTRAATTVMRLRSRTEDGGDGREPDRRHEQKPRCSAPARASARRRRRIVARARHAGCNRVQACSKSIDCA